MINSNNRTDIHDDSFSAQAARIAMQRELSEPPGMISGGGVTILDAVGTVLFTIAAVVGAFLSYYIYKWGVWLESPAVTLLGGAVIIVWVMAAIFLPLSKLREWGAYHRRRDDVHTKHIEFVGRMMVAEDPALAAFYRKMGTIMQERVIDTRALIASNPGHILLIVIWLYTTLNDELKALIGPVILADRVVGTISKDEGPVVADKLAALGLIIGRDATHKGEWANVSRDEAITLVLDNWKHA